MLIYKQISSLILVHIYYVVVPVLGEENRKIREATKLMKEIRLQLSNPAARITEIIRSNSK